MPRYFFHVIDGIETIDSEGTVLADVEEARAEAIVLSGAMLRDSGGKFWNNGQWQLRVVDATGNKVCALHSRPIALKGAVTAFLEAMLGVVPRLGVSLALIIAHEDQRPALALSCYRWASGSNRRSTGSWRNLSRRRSRSRLRRGGRTTRLIGALSRENARRWPISS
ncbi:MAG: DUF6894 family protein [Microvirga sp.]